VLSNYHTDQDRNIKLLIFYSNQLLYQSEVEIFDDNNTLKQDNLIRTIEYYKSLL